MSANEDRQGKNIYTNEGIKFLKRGIRREDGGMRASCDKYHAFFGGVLGLWMGDECASAAGLGNVRKEGGRS